MVDLIKEWEELHRNKDSFTPEEFEKRVVYLGNLSYIVKQILDSVGWLIGQWHEPIKKAPTHVWERLHKHVRQLTRLTSSAEGS